MPKNNPEAYEDPFKGKPLRRAVTRPSRQFNEFVVTLTRGPDLREAERRANPEKFLTMREREELKPSKDAPLRAAFRKRKKKQDEGK